MGGHWCLWSQLMSSDRILIKFWLSSNGTRVHTLSVVDAWVTPSRVRTLSVVGAWVTPSRQGHQVLDAFCHFIHSILWQSSPPQGPGTTGPQAPQGPGTTGWAFIYLLGIFNMSPISVILVMQILMVCHEFSEPSNSVS